MQLLYVLFTFGGILSGSPAITIPAEKILQVTVDETGTVSVGRDTVNADNLAHYIQDRLFKSFMGTGQMQNKILFTKATGNVPDMVVQVVIQEIQEGQNRALKLLCLQRYNNFFEKIDKKKQEKLKKQFPVLFQIEYQ